MNDILEKALMLGQNKKIAEEELGIMRLASRISDLKAAGFPITKKMVTVPTRYSRKTAVAEYSLAQNIQPQSEVN